jgi:putative ABC transport system ATP-binding protein
VDAAIAVRGLNHSFGSGTLRRQVLFDISADVQPGEIVLTTGPSGSGKTTLLTLIGALRSVQEGSLRVLGHELRGATSATMEKVRRKIGYVFQSHNLIPSLTAAENTRIALELEGDVPDADARARSAEILEAVGLAERAHDLPGQLSIGQRQRVAIARALVRRPAIVLADEPTASLDKQAGREVVDILHRLARQQGCCILLVTHDTRILDVADRILTVEDGRLASFASSVTANTKHLMGALAQLQRKGELTRDLRHLPEPQFVELLGEVTTEFERLLQTLDVAGQDVAETFVTDVLEAVTIRIRDLLDADRGTIFLVDRRRGVLRSKIAHHTGGAPLAIELSVDTGLAGHVARTSETINVADAYGDPRFDPHVDRETGYRTRSVLCTPIRDRQQRVFAVAQMLNKRGGGRFTVADEQRFVQAAAPLGIILETCVRLASSPSAIV